MFKEFRKERRAEKESQRLIAEVTSNAKPYTQLWLDFEAFHKLTYSDFMKFVRQSPVVTITSHEVVSIFERNGYNVEAMANDIAALIRDKHVEREADG